MQRCNQFGPIIDPFRERRRFRTEPSHRLLLRMETGSLVDPKVVSWTCKDHANFEYCSLTFLQILMVPSYWYDETWMRLVIIADDNDSPFRVYHVPFRLMIKLVCLGCTSHRYWWWFVVAYTHDNLNTSFVVYVDDWVADAVILVSGDATSLLLSHYGRRY